MISKQMYEILKNIPHSPFSTTFKDMDSKKLVDINILKDLLKDAVINKYIAFDSSNNPYNDILISKFKMTEMGQIAIEEYKRNFSADRKATWALIISGLSLIVAIAAIIVSAIVQ